MRYIYKLVDKDGAELAKKGIISLSHPIFQFKGSEGEFINFAKRIYDKYEKKKLEIRPSKKNIQDIQNWITAYKSSFRDNIKDEDIISESLIIFCGIMQGFCGYFTTLNLLDKSELKKFLENRNFKNKTHVIKLNTSIFKNNHWRTSCLDEPFSPFEGDNNDLEDFNGFTHLTNIVYSENYNDYNELLKIYNGDKLRHASKWFNNISSEYAWQKEKRIIFLLRSLEKNSSRIACKKVYEYPKEPSNLSEMLYCNIIDAIDYCQKGPKFVYLNVGIKNIEIYSKDEVLK